MLRKELVIGFVVAGFASVAVPTSVWRALFLTGHGFGSTVEKCLRGTAGRDYAFCSTGCREHFVADPLAHLSQALDPICGMDVEVAHPGGRASVGGADYVFCGEGCADTIVARASSPVHVVGVTSAGVVIADTNGPVEPSGPSR